MLLNKNAILKNTTSYNKSTKPTSPDLTSNPNPTPKPVPLSSPTPVSRPKQNIRNYTDHKRVNVNTNTTNQNIPQVFDTYTKYVDLNQIPNTNPEPDPNPNSEPNLNIQTQIEKYVKINIKEIITQTIKEYIDTHVKTNANANTDTSNEQITNIVKEIIPSILNNAITQNVTKLTSLTNANHILEEKLEEQINTHNDFKSMMEQKHIHLDYQVKDLQKKILVRKNIGPGSGSSPGQDPHYTLLENKIKELELKIVSLTPDIKN